MQKLSVLIAMFFVAGCNGQMDGTRTLVLEYSDFGPQCLAHRLIGSCWYQWNPCGGESVDDEIKVVVYRGLLQTAKERYPVVIGKSDYRYVACDDASRFLKEELKEVSELAKDVQQDQSEGEDVTWVTELIADLSRTLERVEGLGKQ